MRRQVTRRDASETLSYTEIMARRRRSHPRHRRIILVIGVFVVAAMVFGSALRPWMRKMRTRDLEGSAGRTGIATIEALYGANPNEEDSRTTPWAMIRFEGRLIPARSVSGIERLHVGGPTRITYRIGRSGRIYVDLAEPLEDHPQP